jgi:hypothetical protein
MHFAPQVLSARHPGPPAALRWRDLLGILPGDTPKRRILSGRRRGGIGGRQKPAQTGRWEYSSLGGSWVLAYAASKTTRRPKHALSRIAKSTSDCHG